MSGQQRKPRKKSGGCGNQRPQPNNSGPALIGPNVADSTPSAVIQAVTGLQLTDRVRYAPKPAPGSNGSTIKLYANQFAIKLLFKKPLRVHHYEVVINQEDIVAHPAGGAAANPGSRRRARKLGKQFNRVIVDRMVSENSGAGGLFAGIIPVYDSDKILFTKTVLNRKSKYAFEEDNKLRFGIPVTAAEEEGENPSNFVVILTPVGTLDVVPNIAQYPQEVVQFLDILFRHGPTNNRIPVDDKLFEKKETRERVPLPENKELAFGHYQSVRQTEAGLVLNIDRATCVFHTGGWLIDVFKRRLNANVIQMPRIRVEDIRRMTMDLKFLRFRVTHLSHSFKQRVIEVSSKSASETFFPFHDKDENGVETCNDISVAKYFEKTYGALRFPYLPCLVSGNPDNPRNFPLEVCQLLPDEFVSRKPTPEVQKNVTEISGQQKPRQRFEEIMGAVSMVSKDSSKFLKEFEIEIVPDLVQVKGRVLELPRLKFQDTEIMKPRDDGSWMMQRPEKKKFLDGVSVAHWILVDMSKSPKSNKSIFPSGFLEKFKKQMTFVANEVGMHLEAPKLIARHDFVDTDHLKVEVFEKFKNRFRDLQLIVAIIPEEDGIYKSVKKLGDKDFGVTTQCVSTKHYNPKEETSKLLGKPYLTNLILKINAKLNGINTVLDVPWHAKRVMFVGIDVTHPPPGDRIPFSIASCVASYDKTFVRYFAKLTVQEKSRQEIVELDVLMKDLLAKYFEKNKYYPAAIIIYRDGVSEGQFSHVLDLEVKKLKHLFENWVSDDWKYIPKITYIVVQKRHNTRLIPVNRNDGSKSGNIPAGTVVDTVITDPSLFSFYLCSHNGLLGTSRPALYWVLYDENNFNADAIQKVTFFSCFLVPQATRSVSLPAPVYFAHLSAFRGRQNLLESPNLHDVVGADEGSQILALNELMRVNEKLEGFLFFI